MPRDDLNDRWSTVGDRLERRALDHAERSSRRSPLRIFVGLVLFFTVAGLLAAVIRGAASTVRETGAVLHEELGPRALNEKYEWFKDSYAALDAKWATLSQLDSKITRLRADYTDIPRNQWSRVDLASVNLWETERDAILASYNTLAAQYNAEMAKWHTAFVNAGKLPEGGDGEFPREARPYLKEIP